MWNSYAGAEWAMGIVSVPVTWDQAQRKCEDQGGKLASITTWELQKWIIGRFGLAQDRWIGATDVATEGTFVWSRSSSDPWQFTHWDDCTPANDDTKNCVKVKDASEGRWDIERCDAGLYRYLCQKQTSTSLFWNPHGSTQYAYIEHQTCIPVAGWTSARDLCQGLGDGADLANIPSATHETFLSNTFAATAFQSNYVWISMNDIESEGNLVWGNGASTVYRNWKSGQPGNNHANQDCAAFKHDNFKWELKRCDLVNVKGALCKKALSRKKREVEESPETDLIIPVKTPRRRRAPSHREEVRDPVRVKRSIDTETQRELTCSELWGGTSLYWKYDYEVPAYCWSK